MTPQDLKNSILQLAIQGKLVPQDPAEGNARDLLAQIKAEKDALIKAGKIKKEKPLPEITDDEKPFDIPESWVWVRLGSLFEFINGDRGKNYPSKDKLSSSGEIPFISAINMQHHTIYEDGLLYVSQKQYDALGSGKLKKGDFVVCIRGSLGKCCVYPYEKGAIASSLVILRQYRFIVSEYFMYYLESLLFFSEIRKYDNGTAQPNLSAKDTMKFLIPLPPLSEQHRIVAKIESIFPYIEEYASMQGQLRSIGEDLRKSLLQYAIQGKLVPQDPAEGNARDLLAQIKAEKDALIKAGKIKKEKPLPEITDDEKPFDIPESWKWVRLPDIATSSLGKTLDKAKNTGEYCQYLCSINIQWSGICLNNIKQARFTEIDKEKYKLKKGDLLMCEGGEVGRTAIWNSNEEMYYQNALHRIRFYTNINTYYFKYVYEYYKYIKILDEHSKGVTIKHLVQNELYEIPLPLPPLSEQHRIVAKLEEVLAWIEKL